MEHNKKGSIDEIALKGAGIDEKELKILLAFGDSQEWEVLKKLMKYFKFQADMGLRSPSSTLDRLRHEQGRIGALTELANFVELELKDWYKSRTLIKGERPS